VKSTVRVSGSGQNQAPDPSRVTTTGRTAGLSPPEEKLMVNKQRPDDYIESQEPDVEGHRVLRAGDDEADVEGHRVLRTGDDEADVEGHRVLRISPDADGDDDVEGHRVLR
jgi:hypothetical protein